MYIYCIYLYKESKRAALHQHLQTDFFSAGTPGLHTPNMDSAVLFMCARLCTN